MPFMRLAKSWFALACLVALAGCASSSSYLKGVDKSGKKVYLGPLPIENTEAYRAFAGSRRTEADKEIYLFKRLKSATALEFFHDGSWYNSVQAYRGGMWLVRHR